MATTLGGIWNGTRWCTIDNGVYAYAGTVAPLGERLYTEDSSWIPPHSNDTAALLAAYEKAGAVLAGVDGVTPGGGAISHYLPFINPHNGDLDANGNLGYNTNCVDTARSLGQCIEGDPVAAGAHTGVTIDLMDTWGGKFMVADETGPDWIRRMLMMCPPRSYAYVYMESPAHLTVAYRDAIGVLLVEPQVNKYEMWPNESTRPGWAAAIRVKMVGGWAWWA